MAGFMDYLQPGLKAIKRFYLPFLLVQITSVSLVIAYYHVPAFAQYCMKLGEWKVEGGTLFAGLTTVFAGGILPEIAKALTGRLDYHQTRKAYLIHVFWICLMFSCTGILVERFYWVQSRIFGHTIAPGTVLIKVAVDQFLFTPFMSLPYSVIYFLWLEESCCVKRTLKRLTWPLLIKRSIPLLLPNWAYWIPMTLCLYSLPTDLQFPLFLTAMAAWSLIFVSMAQQPKETPLPPVIGPEEF